MWSIIQIDSTIYPPRSVANIFGNWFNGVNHRFKVLIRVVIIWSIWLCRNHKVFDDKKILSCKLSTGVVLCFVHGRLFGIWRITTSLRMSLHSWRTRRKILLYDMGVRLVLSHLRSWCSFMSFIVSDILFSIWLWLVCGCVHPSYAGARCNT
jgi:hypothetical protein